MAYSQHWGFLRCIVFGVTYAFVNTNLNLSRQHHKVSDSFVFQSPSFLGIDSSQQRKQELRPSNLIRFASNKNENDEGGKRKRKRPASGDGTPSKKKKRKPKRPDSPSKARGNKSNTSRNKKKEEIMQKLKAKLDEKKKKEQEEKESNKDGGLLDVLNPFKAGQTVRKTIGTLTALGSGLPEEARQKYYLDDRFQEDYGGSGGVFSERNPFVERLERDSYVPEVLVIGATGEVGQLVVRRLLLEGRFRVRVLVRDLYSKTLNVLGTGVTYCQGDLSNMESLEYALTDVDKIVFCAAAPRPDEKDFQKKFQSFVKENLKNAEQQKASQAKRVIERQSNENDDEDKGAGKSNEAIDDTEWEQLASVLEVRAQLAEQVDCIGMQNVVRAYQNVRHADYGTSQAAKRSLFKFQSREEDCALFDIDDGDVYIDQQNELDDAKARSATASSSDRSSKSSYDDDKYLDKANDPYAQYDDNAAYVDEYGDYDDEYGSYNDEYFSKLEQRRDATVKTECKWIRNEFGQGVFVGKVPKVASTIAVGGEAAIVSSRLRARDDPENGLDLSAGFAGLIVRLCGDGGNYEAFVRTKAYEDAGVEYVCPFSTATKMFRRGNKSRNKFITVRLPFESFKPVSRKENNSGSDGIVIQPFKGTDVRNIGFRFRSASNEEKSKRGVGEKISFYVALSYIKVYRTQPEPEFVYLSDARIPRVIQNGMVRHDRRQLLTDKEIRKEGNDGNMVQLFDERAIKKVTENKLARSREETYFKFRGEEILKNSGLSYTIVRVSGFNEVQGGEASTIDLDSSNEGGVSPVSRDETAQVCVSALLDTHALNKSVYMSKIPRGQRSSSSDENISAKFEALPSDLT